MLKRLMSRPAPMRRDADTKTPGPGSETGPPQGPELQAAAGAAAQAAEEEEVPALKPALDNIDARCVWDGLPGIPFKTLDFGPARGPLLRRGAASGSAMPVPLNLRPWSTDLLPRPHTRQGRLVQTGKCFMRLIDLADWYLTSPVCRHEIYAWKLRSRLESPLSWRHHRLRAVLRDRPPGAPRWLSGTVQAPIEGKAERH